jgi:hypothetical protein
MEYYVTQGKNIDVTPLPETLYNLQVFRQVGIYFAD